ncbi:Na+/H+ antiporter NhaC family protein [Sedimentibacter sp.]|uniref:Na+/H+ antiporter NhaC family protein n=1 Tax=Sedimentibacter sp. TaxID=1960295 RepID=UPI002896BACA|nr:Na+/H+ antiporter NhaC family protein [Sedimentibacter sp.]
MEYGILSILPPVFTIALAIYTKNVFIALFLGVFLGNFVIHGWDFFVALNSTLNGFISIFESHSNTIVIASILLIGALIYIIEKSGGIEGFVEVMVRKKGLIKSKRAAGIFTWLMGVFVFTSGTLSTLVVGSVTRPINDALKVPHEKSSFIVHTTSTPVCVLLPLSGWGASMIGYLTSGGVPEAEATTILVQSIGLNFYCIIAVFGTLLLTIFKKDFGPMKKAELRAEATGQLDAPSSIVAKAESFDDKLNIDTDKPLARNLLLPISTLIAVIIAVLLITGKGNLLNGDGMNALLWGVFASIVVAGILCISQKIYNINQFIEVMFKGAGGMLSISMILVFGFAMGGVVKQLGTGLYLSSIFENFLTPALLPALVFIMACIISFATGTSMGTMAITSVIALPMAYNLGVSIPLVASAVFGGSIFGDHSSPISDTTIMSCSTTGCNIIDHIKSQIPYCFIAATATIILYVIFGFIL